MRRRRFSCETLSAPNSCCAWNFQVRPTTYPISPVSTLDTLAWPARFSTCSGDSRGQRSAGTATSRFPMLRRVENTVDGKTNVQILGRAAHLKLDQLLALGPLAPGSMQPPPLQWTTPIFLLLIFGNEAGCKSDALLGWSRMICLHDCWFRRCWSSCSCTTGGPDAEGAHLAR